MMLQVAITIAAVLLRWSVSLHPYSGMGNPPMHGDYEAQRHFMEVAYNLDVNQWYFYDLEYWGLDYPPLTGWHSRLMGAIADKINPTWIALDTSRGFESSGHKLFMRWTVLLSELLIYFPACYFLCTLLTLDAISSPGKTQKKPFNWKLYSILLFQPALIIIDHGHFQYNSVMLGFMLWSVYYFLQQKNVLGSVFFCCALGFKHMSLYYALPVFFYLLGKCFRRGDIFLLFKLGITVIACFTVILGPFYYYGGINGLQQVLHRLFPFQRGLFEDKVGNFWCALNVLVKLKNMFDIPQLVRLSAVATLVTSVPSCLKVFFYPSRKAFLNALSCTSLAFFLFSFQVHEKSILIPLLPVLLLSNTDYCNALIVEWFINISMFSMFPLILKDKLVLAFVGLLLVWNSLSLFTLNGPFSGKSQPFATFLKNVVRISYFLAASILIAQAFVEPPAKYPDLFAVLNSVLSATCFGIIYLYFLFQRTY